MSSLSSNKSGNSIALSSTTNTTPLTDNQEEQPAEEELGQLQEQPAEEELGQLQEQPAEEELGQLQDQPPIAAEQNQQPSPSPSNIITNNTSKLDLIEQLSNQNSETEEDDLEDQLVILFDEQCTISQQQEHTESKSKSTNDSLQLLTASDEEEQSLSARSEDEADEEIRLTLDRLPVELLLHIFNFISALELQENVKLTCKRFNWILLNELSWKIRYERFWLVGRGGRFPPIQQQAAVAAIQQQAAAAVAAIQQQQQPAAVKADSVDEPTASSTSHITTPAQFPWSIACIEREEQLKYWTNPDLACIELSNHIACVDTVRLIKNGGYLVSGSRDRSMNVYKLGDVDNEVVRASAAGSPPPVLSINKENAHLGWIWCLTQVGDKYLCSGSWDNTVKLWDLEAGLQCVTEFKTTAPVLCCYSSTSTNTSNLIAAGTFTRLVNIYDIRTNQPVISYKGHRRSVLKVIGRKSNKTSGEDNSTADFNEIISCGDDGRICLYDIRAKKGRNLIQLPPNNYASCLSTQSKLPQISHFGYAGDKQGNLYLIDLERFIIVKNYNQMHTRPIQQIHHSLGSIKTCSSDSTLNIYEPSTELRLLNTRRFNYIGEGGPGNPVELTDLDCYRGITVIGASDGIVRVFQ